MYSTIQYSIVQYEYEVQSGDVDNYIKFHKWIEIGLPFYTV